MAEATDSSYYKFWARDGITRRTIDRNFGRAFNQAVKRADSINFALDGIIDDLDGAFQRGSAGFTDRNITNAEFYTVFRDPLSLNKTNFFYENRPVSPLIRTIRNQ